MKKKFFIAGVQFRPRDEINRAAKLMKEGDELLLEVEPSNKYDPNAIKILFVDVVEGERRTTFLGYVPKKFSSEISALIELDSPLVCVVEAVDAHKIYAMFKVIIKDVYEENEDK